MMLISILLLLNQSGFIFDIDVVCVKSFSKCVSWAIDPVYYYLESFARTISPSQMRKCIGARKEYVTEDTNNIEK